MTGIKHLKCLSAVKSMKTIHPLTPAAFPGNHCPMHTALSLGTRIKGVSTLVIGTSECGYYSRNIPIASPYADQSLHWTYILDSKEVVFGFRDGIINSIREMDAAGAKIILLLATCVPELIGEDIDSICYEIQPRIKARLLHIPLGNFKCGSYQPGYWKTLKKLGSLTEKASIKTKTVNILGRSVLEEHIPIPEIVSVLRRNQVPLRFLSPDSSLEDFVSAGDAQMSISLSPFMNPLAEYLEKEHDVPFISLHDVYSVKEINEVYTVLENHLELKIIPDMKDLKKEADLLQTQAAMQLKDTSYIMANIGALQPLPLSAYFSELGMSPIMIHMEEYYPSDSKWKESLLARDKNPILCLMFNEHADKTIIQELCPHIVIGDWGGRNQTKPPTLQTMDFYGQAGYERTISLLNRIITIRGRSKEADDHGII